MFCKFCGNEVSDDAYVCINCGRKLKEESENFNDKANIALILVSAFIPIVGIILWLFKRKKTPSAAKTYGLVGLVASLIWTIIL